MYNRGRVEGCIITIYAYYNNKLCLLYVENIKKELIVEINNTRDTR